jgi:hypothetical protein
MAIEEPGAHVISAPALLTLAAKQYCFVTMNASGEAIAIAADTTYPVGILQNTPAAGQTAQIMVRGISKLKCNAAGFVCGAPLGPDAVGLGITRVLGAADNLHYQCGYALDTTGAQEGIVGTILLVDPTPVMIA